MQKNKSDTYDVWENTTVTIFFFFFVLNAILTMKSKSKSNSRLSCFSTIQTNNIRVQTREYESIYRCVCVSMCI